MNMTATTDVVRLNDDLMERMSSAIKMFSSRYQITLRESEILRLIAIYGFSNREIAERCVISEKTVKNHIANMMNKIGIQSMRKLLSLLFVYVHYTSEKYTPMYVRLLSDSEDDRPQKL